MLSLGVVSAARIASLATGRGGAPTADEWPVVLLLLLLLGLFGGWMLVSAGLTRVEAALVAGLSPVLVLVDAPLGQLSATTTIAANAAGCLIPVAVGSKVLLERRFSVIELALILAVGIASAFLASHVVPGRGVMLQYRVPAFLVAFTAAILLRSSPARAGAAAFAAGAFGVLIGADLLRLKELQATGGAGRVILGGAGLLDGIFLVAILAAALASSMATVSHLVLRARRPAAGRAT